MGDVPYVGVSTWSLRQQVAMLRGERKKLEVQVEALTAVAEEVVGTCAFAEGMAFSFPDWVKGVLLPMAREALAMGTEK